VDVDRLAGAFERAPIAGVVSAYVFGSRAGGAGHRESDVDVGVLLDRAAHPTRRDRFEARLTLISHVGHALRTSLVDLVIINDVPPHLARRILLDGRRVWCANAGIDHAARRTAMLRAADLEPFLRRLRRIKLQAMTR
jgi:predicted nucleotidyltransferase